MKQWKVGKTDKEQERTGSKAAACLYVGDTGFLLIQAGTGRTAPPELLDQIVYEHNLARPEAPEPAAGVAVDFTSAIRDLKQRYEARELSDSGRVASSNSPAPAPPESAYLKSWTL